MTDPTIAALIDEWKSAYAAYRGAFDTPLARSRDSSEYAEDARRRMHDFSDNFANAMPAIFENASIVSELSAGDSAVRLSRQAQEIERLRAELAIAQAQATLMSIPSDSYRAKVEVELDRRRDEIDKLGLAIRDMAVAVGGCRDDATLTVPQLVMVCGDAVNQIEFLRAELAECKRDAERYRFCRMQGHIQLHTSDGGRYSLDEDEIDAALAQQSKEAGAS